MKAGREIKFRAWDGSKLISVVYPKSNYKFEVDWDGKFKLHTFHERQEITDEHGETWKQPIWETVENAVIMQFTGLCDANNTPIYEGDILEDFFSKKRYEVIWDSYGMFLFNPVGTKGSAIDYYEFEDEVDKCATIVVGNRYENPNLLEVGN